MFKEIKFVINYFNYKTKRLLKNRLRFRFDTTSQLLQNVVELVIEQNHLSQKSQL